MSTAIVVFAKAPVPGLAKTRLAPALGEAGAAALAERMLRHALAQAVAADVGPVELRRPEKHTAAAQLGLCCIPAQVIMTACGLMKPFMV